MGKRISLWRTYTLSLLTFFTCSVAKAQVTSDTLFRINPDGSVVFSFHDTNANNVKVYCDCKLRHEKSEIKRENYHSVRMKKDSAGYWTYTTPPLPPEVYTYQFEAYGQRFPDPNNADSIRVRREKMSVFIIDGTPQTNLYSVESLQGRVDTVLFQCGPEMKTRKILVYTPPGYDKEQHAYPVLYLLHGLNGNETSWNDRGRAVQVLENLILQHRAAPMIMVIPDANPECLISKKEDIGLFKNIMLYPSWNKMEFENCYPAMDDYLSQRYRFSNVKGSRAVAGLSAGAKQAANLANMYDSTFCAVGMFSPVVGWKQLPENSFSKYWIGGGTGDLFHHRINKFRKRLQRKHFQYTMYNTRGGHTWRNWRVYFTEYVQTLFWNCSH